MNKIVLIMLIAVLGTFSSNAQIQKVDQEVFGMDCAPCAYGLERGLKKMDGLQSVKVSLNDGKAYLELAENNNLSLKQIQEEVKKNGFSAKEAEVTIAGKMVKKNDGFELQTKVETYTLSGNLLSKLKPGTVKLRGIVQDKEDGNLTNQWNLDIIEML